MSSRTSAWAYTAPGPLRLYSTAELMALPPPEWLVDKALPIGALATLYGPPESYKSFIALDLALCVATGLPWHGHSTKPGFVVYVAAEGGAGIGKRVRAWLQAYGYKPPQANIAWLIESMMIHKDSEDVETLMKRLDEELSDAPVLIVVDTLARAFEGDENTQQDMGAFVAGLDQLRKAYGSSLLCVHHTRADGDRERGSTALRGGLDTMMEVSRDPKTDTCVLSCTKQKDWEHFEDVGLLFRPMEGTDSGIILSEATDRESRTLRLFTNPRVPLTYTELVSRGNSQGLSSSTIQRGLLTAQGSGKILKEKGKYWVINGQGNSS